MQSFKEKMRAYYPADAQSKVAHHFMNNDPSRHGMKEEDMTQPRDGVPPNRRFKTGGHVRDDASESPIAPTAAIGKRMNEAYQRTAHKHGGSIKSQKGLPHIAECASSGPTAGHKKDGGSMHTVKHMHTHRHYDAGGNVNPDKAVPSDIGLNPSPKTSREQYDAQRGTKPIYRAMGGAGKIRKGVMDSLGRQMTS